MALQGFRAILVPLLLGLLVGCSPADAGSGANPAAAPGPGGPLEVTAMTYNVLGSPVPDDWFPLIARDQLVPMVRAPGVVAKIELADPDLIGFQEFASGSPSGNYLQEHLPAYTWLHSPGEHAMAVRSSRFEVLASGSEQLNQVGELGSLLDRFADWARLRDLRTGRTLLAVNVHQHPLQSPEFAAVRSMAVDRLVVALRRLDPGLGDPLVLLGDFNAGNAETRPVFADHLMKLAAAGIVDASTLARKDSSDVRGANSLHQMSAGVAGQLVAKVVRRNRRHIDYVWVPRSTTVLTWAVLSGPGVEWQIVSGKRVPVWTGIIPSDHSPVVARLRYA